MNSRDRHLGMDVEISRRDFLNGVGVAIGASLLPACARNNSPITGSAAPYYPPSRTGMRGSHPGSFEAAHATVAGRHWEARKTDEHYDLVVVGAGISGLSAAYIYRRDIDPNARILILDNHDDFGGHAKRNEFTLDGRTLLAYGGTQMMEAPEYYPATAKQVIDELGIEYKRSADFYHRDLYRSLGMENGTFFDKETYGKDFLAIGNSDNPDWLNDTPLSAPARTDLHRLYADKEDYLAGMTPAGRRTVLESHSWREYLEKFGNIDEEALDYIQQRPHGNWAIGSDALPAIIAWMDGYPGFADMDLGLSDEEDSEEGGGGFRFPDGNASIARLLVRKLVPAVAPGDSMEDVIAARFDYAVLDKPENLTRIRLSTTVVDLHHHNGDLKADVDITYVRDKQARSVTAGKVIWAGYHAMLPYICPDIPKEQLAAQRKSVRAPLVYTNVLIRNWKSFVNLGLRRTYCPGGFYHSVMIGYPISMGDYQFPQSPDEPMVLSLTHIPLEPGLSAPEQFRSGRRTLLGSPFETFERNARDQLGRILGPGGFEPARDIAAVTVNRWAHGYAYSVDEESGDVAWWPQVWRHDNRPWVDARKRVGNITIAGTDASSNAMSESAIEEAHRAVHGFRPG